MKDVKQEEEFEVTRCTECFSDRIYAFQDAEGGMCLACKLLISGPIRGGIGKHELMRLRGELPAENVNGCGICRTACHCQAPRATHNCMHPEIPKDTQKPPVAVTARNVQAVVASLGKSSTSIPAVPVVAHPLPPKGPGMIQKTVGFIRKFQEEWKKTAPKPEPKPAAAAASTPAAPPVPVAPPSVPALVPTVPKVVAPTPVGKIPMAGETWEVGKCLVCKNPPQKVRGPVVPANNKKLVTIRDTNGFYWSGCFLCAKKIG